MHSVFPLLLCVLVSILYTVSCEENVDTNILSDNNVEIGRYARDAERKRNNNKDKKKGSKLGKKKKNRSKTKKNNDKGKKRKNKQVNRSSKKKTKKQLNKNRKKAKGQSKKRSGKRTNTSKSKKKEKKNNRRSKKDRKSKKNKNNKPSKKDRKSKKKNRKSQHGKGKGKKTHLSKFSFRQTNSTATCSGASLGATCLANLKASMKYDRDKIANFRNQLQRSKDFNKTIGGKGGKMDVFANTTTYLLMALGGNMSNINCSGDPTLTANATETYTTLANCSQSVDEACAVPKNQVNYTLMETCGKFYKKVQDKNNDCLDMKTNGTAICECWSEASTLTSEAKAVTKKDGCDALGAQSGMKKLKSNCIKAFGECKKAEDASVRYIMVCSGNANLMVSNSSVSTNSTSTNSTSVGGDSSASTNSSISSNSSTSTNSSSNTNGTLLTLL